MSTWQPFAVRCLECEQPYNIALMDAFNASRTPEIRQGLLDQTLHMPECPHCGLQVLVEFETVYTDFKRGHYIGVCVGDGATWRADVERHRQAFDQSFTLGPEIANEIGWGLRTRMVYGLDALREKLVIWEAGLDDRVIEAVKGDLLRALGETVSESLLRLTAVLDEEQLVFARVSPASATAAQGAVRRRGALLGHLSQPMAVYWRRQQHRATITGDYPWLGTEWLVDLRATRP